MLVGLWLPLCVFVLDGQTKTFINLFIETQYSIFTLSAESNQNRPAR